MVTVIAIIAAIVAVVLMVATWMREAENEAMVEIFERDMRINTEVLEVLKNVPLDEVSFWKQMEDEYGSYSVCAECNYQYNNLAYFEIYTSKFCPNCGRYMVNWSDHEKGKDI